MDLLALAKDFGFPVICVIACGWFIRSLVMDRIKAMESALKAGLAREATTQEERIKAANNFADAMRQMAERTTKALERNTAVAEKNQEVLVRLLDSIVSRPCLRDHEPHPQSFHQDARPPSSAELPAVDPPTEPHGPQDRRWRQKT